jgi:hypothetical protein
MNKKKKLVPYVTKTKISVCNSFWNDVHKNVLELSRVWTLNYVSFSDQKILLK